jgi:type II secretory pathway pseudopilin PulG
MPKQNNIKAARYGFSLIELAICFTIIALLLGSVLAISGRAIETSKHTQTIRKMQTIEAALRVFANSYDYLPCPAQTLNFSDGNLGVQRLNGGHPNPSGCDGVNGNTTGGVYSGDVPFMALQLSADYLVDGWGRRFTYIVDQNVVGTKISAVDVANINIIIKDGRDNPATTASAALRSDSTNGGNTITQNAAYVLMSHGPNGSYAYNARGTNYFDVSGGVNEDRNCPPSRSCSGTYWNNIFIDGANSKEDGFVFDDILIYKKKDELK